MAHDVLIVGGGLASARAVASYREAGGDGSLALVSRDRFVPYHRPPLSKRYLRGEIEREGAFVQPEEFYREHDVDLLLETSVASVEPAERAVELGDGRRLAYRKLLLATGAWPRRLDVPGGSLDQVLTLRTLDDSTRIREAAAEHERAVVVGGSFIGMEVAASLRTLGLEVTLVHRGSGLFDGLGVPSLAHELAELYRERGVELVLEDEAAAFRGNGRLERVETRSGRSLAAGFAVVGVGVEPVVDLLAGSGLEVEDGVVVDEGFAASAPDVYAAGDVASFLDPVFGRRRRIEHWSNANYQGTEVGRVLAGEPRRYDNLSTFFSEVFGIGIKVFGDPQPAQTVVQRGSVAEGSLIAFFLDGRRLRATLVVGQGEETESALKELIREGATASPDDVLRDPAVPVADAFASRA